MTIRLRDGLPYVTASLPSRGQRLDLEDIVLDTGSAGTVLAAEKVSTIGSHYEAEDGVHPIHGIGGVEFAFAKRIERLSVGELRAHDFEIEVGAMDYGFDIDGFVGMDFLVHVGAVVNLAGLEIQPPPADGSTHR